MYELTIETSRPNSHKPTTILHSAKTSSINKQVSADWPRHYHSFQNNNHQTYSNREIESNHCLHEVAVYLLFFLNPSDLRNAVRKHTKGLLIITRCNNPIVKLTIIPQNCCFDGFFSLLYCLILLLLMQDTFWDMAFWFANYTMDEDLHWQGIWFPCKIYTHVQVVHLTKCPISQKLLIIWRIQQCIGHMHWSMISLDTGSWQK